MGWLFSLVTNPFIVVWEKERLEINTNIENKLIDMDDVTRVEFDEETISCIGKNLEKFNGFKRYILKSRDIPKPPGLLAKLIPSSVVAVE
ncbi:MAG: hypothetical protein IID16_09270 [Candidatus Marinimicrobia bacterium]|nr:hypothetical protein [Candidatus Neomarinimicrobiota bacterium]